MTRENYTPADIEAIYGKKTELTREERMEKLNAINKAQELIYQAQELLDDAVNDTEQKAEYEAYGRYGIDQLLGNGNPYDKGIQNLIDELSNEL
tara:strand:- start:410 stop:691 length:282 start_codon:yes stop_codon:yes gene_type:complete